MRLANKFDILECVEMMRRYALEGPIAALKDESKHDQQHIEQLLISLIAGRGFVLIEEGKGMIAGAVVPNFWVPKVREVKELAWWVHPDYRGGLTGGKLFIGFQKHAQDLIDLGRADFVTMTLMEQSPKLNIEAKGFRPIEKTFVRESCHPV